MPINPLLSLLGFFLILPASFAESPNCLTVYNEGGAPAVFNSPKCPRWTFPSSDDLLRRRPPSGCQLAILQGRRRFQEDRAVCALDIKIPFLGRTGIKQINVGIVAVFDGHNGAEASDMASKLLLDYFLLHAYFLLDITYSMVLRNSPEMLSSSVEPDMNFQELNFDKEEIWSDFDPKRFRWMSPIIFDGPFHLEILKESLLRTIHDIDATFVKGSFVPSSGDPFCFPVDCSSCFDTDYIFSDFMQDALGRNLVSDYKIVWLISCTAGDSSKINRRNNDDLSPASGHGEF